MAANRHLFTSVLNPSFTHPQGALPGGVFVSIHEGLTHEKTKPEKMMLGWQTAELLGEDITSTQEEIADSMIRVGFRSVRSRTIGTPIGEMDLDVGRKA